MINFSTDSQMSESLSVGLLLASVGGFLESYSFICRDGVFANCQTGNMVLLSMYLAKGDWTHVISYFIPILSFVVGVILTEFIHKISNNHKLHWRQYIILFELALLATVGFIPSGKYNIVATTLIAFSCSMQVECFRKVKGSVYATTMCTGNLRSGTFQLFEYFCNKDRGSLRKAGNYFAVILIFMAGAIVGGITTELWGEYAIFLSCTVLLLVFFIMFIHPQEESTE